MFCPVGTVLKDYFQRKDDLPAVSKTCSHSRCKQLVEEAKRIGVKENPHIIHPSIGDRRDDRFLQADFSGLSAPWNPDTFRLADYPGATRKASNPPLIHVELGLVNLHSRELNFLQ